MNSLYSGTQSAAFQGDACTAAFRCRHCAGSHAAVIADLGTHPPSNAYLGHAALDQPEPSYPLQVLLCEACGLAQLPGHVAREDLFTSDYAYFSSMSESWLAHARSYVGTMRARFGLDAAHLVCEVGSNDGYLLQYAQEAGMRVLGVEPTQAAAERARAKGIDTETVFFGQTCAAGLRARHGPADLMPANNVLAHVPDINDFGAGFAIMLADHGVATFEFPHLMSLLDGCQFDTIYHEHYSYLSLDAASRIMRAAGLRIFDLQEIETHGGSLRIFVCRQDARHVTRPAVADFMTREARAGLRDPQSYTVLQSQAERIADDLRAFLIAQKKTGRRVVGYGAAAKGNTLLNFAGVCQDLLAFVCDKAPLKQGCYLPGSHIPIVGPEMLEAYKPDIVLILPWNIVTEITAEHAMIADWEGRFAVAVPRMRLIEP